MSRLFGHGCPNGMFDPFYDHHEDEEFGDRAPDFEPPVIFQVKLNEDFTWKTREGEKIKYYAMEDAHLLNSFRMLKRKGFFNPFINYEIERRGLKDKI